MAGNPEPIIDLEEDDDEEEIISIKGEVDSEDPLESGVPLGKLEGRADNKQQEVADPEDDQPGDQGSLQTASPDERAANFTAEYGELKLVSHGFAGAQHLAHRKGTDCVCVFCWSSGSDRHENESISKSSRTKKRLTPQEIKLRKADASGAKKLEATLSGNLLACEKCDFKTFKQGVMARHIKAHTGYVPCACNFCDFKCRGVGVFDKHVIENHLDEMDRKTWKRRKIAKRGENANARALSSNPVPYYTIPHLYDPIEIRYRKKKALDPDKLSSDVILPQTAEKGPPKSCSGSSESETNTSLANKHSTSHSAEPAAQEGLSAKRNVLATQQPASLYRRARKCDFCSFKCRGVTELEGHIKIHTPSAAVPEDLKPELADLPRNKLSIQLTVDSADITMGKGSSRVSKELVVETDSISTSSRDLPPKKKLTSTGKRFRLDDLLKEKLSAKLKSAEQSTDADKEISEHAESYGESQLKNENTTLAAEKTPSKSNTRTKKPAGRHIKVNSEMKTYSCDFCDFKGKGIHGLKKHMMIHTPSVSFGELVC